ncbi:hypothetical protein ACWD01_08860 [Streptomyces sp. NPDC002835]
MNDPSVDTMTLRGAGANCFGFREQLRRRRVSTEGGLARQCEFRERSYFLQQTADAIEEEANAVRLGIGPYSEYGPGSEGEALKLFTQRVEQHRSEQRRRQQQLDQPADQAAPSSQPPAACPERLSPAAAGCLCARMQQHLPLWREES